MLLSPLAVEAEITTKFWPSSWVTHIELKPHSVANIEADLQKVCSPFLCLCLTKDSTISTFNEAVLYNQYVSYNLYFAMNAENVD